MPTSRISLVEQLLQFNGPSLSSTIAALLVKNGSSPSNARKLIQRAGNQVGRLHKIRFAHNDRFLYRMQDFRSARFWERLFESFEAKESVYGLALNALTARNGFMPRAHFEISCGSPFRMKGQIGVENVLKGLEETKLVSVVDHAEFGSCVVLTSEIPLDQKFSKPGAVRAQMLAEDLVLVGLREWIRNTALRSFEKVATRSNTKGAEFGQFRWDLSAPSYVHPLSRFDRSTSKVQPGFLVADILLNGEVSLAQLKPFLRKISTMRAQRSTFAFLGIFIASRFTREAFEAGRKAGILIATVESFFGREVSAGIIDFVNVLTNAAEAVNSDPNVIERLFSKLDALRGADLNVKGALFELLVARAFNADGYNIDAMNEPVRTPEGNCEIDVLARRSSRLVAVECKGYQKTLVSLVEVKKWCEKTIPWSSKILRGQRLYRNSELEFEFWASTGFTQEALDYLTAVKASARNYQICWKNQHEVRRLLELIGDQYLLKVWRSHYSPALTEFNPQCVVDGIT